MSVPRLIHLLFLGLLLLGYGVMAHASGNCPEGESPMGGNPADPGNCGPDSTYQRPAVKWEDRWGAVAQGAPTAAPGFGAIEGMQTRMDAERAAIAVCEAQGQTKCTVLSVYADKCVAVTVGKSQAWVNTADTVDAAVKRGMHDCTAGDTECQTYYTACSLAVRVQ